MVGHALRIAFFGTPDFAVPSLDALLTSGHTVVGVVTQPDRPRGRGQQIVDAPVKAKARAAGLPLLQPAVMKDPGFLAGFEAWHPDLGVVAAYGKLLSTTLLAVPRLGMVNVHASLLPRYRGAAPVHRAVINGESETGVTIMRVVKALDAGPMLSAVRRPIGPDETSAAVERDLARLGAELLVRTIDRLAGGGVEEVPQDDAAATYAPRLTKDEGLIDWSRPARQIHDLVRGLHPWPHAFAFLEGERIIVHRSEVVETGAEGVPGQVLSARGDEFVVLTGTGALRLLDVQIQGRRPLHARDFLAGHPVAAGSVFGTTP